MKTTSTGVSPPPAGRLKVTQILEATGGGTRRHLRQLVFGLDPGRFEVSVICSLGREADFQADVTRMRERGIIVETAAMSPGFSPAKDWLSTRRVTRILRRLKPDIVHTHSTKAGWIGRAAAKAAGAPAILHSPHGWPFDMGFNRLKQRLVQRLEKKLAAITDGFICCCEDERAKGIDGRLAEADTFHLIPNGIDVTEEPPIATARQLQSLNGGLIIGFVGRLEPQKGVLWLVEAVASILKARHDIRLAVIGDGALRSALERRLANLGIRDRCDIMGHVDDPRVFLPRIDIIVIPSWWEGLPYTLLDSMRAGKPVIATDVGGMTEVLAGGAGVLIPPGNAARAQKALLELIDSPDLRRQLAARAEKRVERYSLTEMVYHTQMVYESFRHHG
ncbi:MAG: glycosyltransferase family 4 protein [Lentisphaeria bacterium]|nr:glycosyltransferase family 4 protein [Lentisphaeria bacterium]